ncbi:hypothetical protein Pfo_009479 [Paulownia fortunei]|nr:hypothetical protein Pfo_009479 [Paulownia fortunei]
MEDFTHCEQSLFLDIKELEKRSFTTCDQPTSSSPQFHINFKFSCKPVFFEWVLHQDSAGPQFLRRVDPPLIQTFILVNLQQLLSEKARETIGRELKDWPVRAGRRRQLIDVALNKAREVVKSMSPGHNAVYLDFSLVAMHRHVLDERRAISSTTQQSMEEDKACMVPAVESSIESLESKTLLDSGTCSICLEEFSMAVKLCSCRVRMFFMEIASRSG